MLRYPQRRTDLDPRDVPDEPEVWALKSGGSPMVQVSLRARNLIEPSALSLSIGRDCCTV
jgi:hypothetical protein